jgi:hypothetical protein
MNQLHMIRKQAPKSSMFHPLIRMAPTARYLTLAGFLVISGICSSCSHTSSSDEKPPSTANTSAPAGAVPDVKAIADKYTALDTSHDSTMKLKATVQRNDGTSEQVQLTVYRQREPDGDQHVLVQFTAPAEEKDRDALINVTAKGDTEAVRYAESAKNFLTAKSATDEESLFGMTIQELIGGQPEKYDYKFIDEETYQGEPVYRIEGTLKHGAESRFARVVMLVSKQNNNAPMMEVYDGRNELARRITVTKAESISGIWTRTQWTIDNQEQHKKIDFDAVDVKYNQNLPSSIFTKDHLKEVASR